MLSLIYFKRMKLEENSKFRGNCLWSKLNESLKYCKNFTKEDVVEWFYRPRDPSSLGITRIFYGKFNYILLLYNYNKLIIILI